MVVDDVEVPKNIADMEQTEIKSWLFGSIIKDTKKFIEELGLKTDTNLSEKIKTTENLDEKSILELEYIRKAHEQVDAVVQNFD